MTSQPLRLDSAEHSSALSEGQSGAAETEAVNILSQISKGIPVPSVHPSPQHSVPYGLPLHPGNAIQSSSRVQPSKISECQPSSVGARPTKTRETRVVKRLAARSSKNAHQMPLSPTGTYKLPDPLEFRSSGPPLSFHNRQPACAFFPSNPSMVTRRPVSAPSEYPDTPFDLSAYSSRPPRPSSSTSSIPSIGSPNLGLRSSFGLHHGPPGIPVLPPVNEILPAATQIMPNTGPSSFQPPPLQYSVEVNGYMIIRNAIHVGLIRSVAEIIREGLPVSGRSEMAQTYVPPIQAYEVRDEFILNCHDALRPFYEPMGRNIPQMPTTNYLGSFTASEPTNLKKSLIHCGNNNQLMVYIALTTLSPENGLFEILQGSHEAKHPSRTPVKDWSPLSITLLEGDAFVWRGDLSYINSCNGGGMYQCMTFPWGPAGTVDLTED